MTIFTDLIKFNWPCRELVEQASFPRWARNKSFGEDVKQRWWQSYSHHFLHDRGHKRIQQPEVFQTAVLKLASIAQSDVDSEI